MFDGEHGIALHTMHGNQTLSGGEGEVSWFFSSCGRNQVYILELQWGWPFKTCICSATSGLLYSYEGHLRNLREAWAVRTLLEVRREIQCPFLLSITVILGFLSIFKKSQVLSPFAALNSSYLSRCQRDVRPPVQMRWGPMAFSRVSTGDSDNPSSCEMDDEPEFKPLL